MNNKQILLGLMLLMPFAGMAKSTISYSSRSADGMKKDLLGNAIGMAVVAPISGLMLGCERRTLNTMQDTVEKQLNVTQKETFNEMYVQHKMDTKPYTTATGPLSLAFAAGIAVGVSNPVGFAVASVAAAGNIGVLLLAEKAQRYNRDRYERAVAAINLEKSLDKSKQINGDAGLSDLQKMFCIGRGSL